jgi:hypothetical protein
VNYVCYFALYIFKVFKHFHHHYHQPINLLTAGTQAFLMDYPPGERGHNLPRGPSADRWVLTTANAAGTNSLTYLPKQGGAQGNKFWSPN